MVVEKMLNRTHIQCGKCRWIVPYKQKIKKGLVIRTVRHSKCNKCDTPLGKNGRRYYNM